MKRKLAAILSANAVGYGRLMGEDEARTLQTLKGHRQGMCSLVEKHQGRVVLEPDPKWKMIGKIWSRMKRWQKVALPIPDKPSIAVLPLENMTGDPKQEYFADGFTEQIITSLSKIPALLVISRNSTSPTKASR